MGGWGVELLRGKEVARVPWGADVTPVLPSCLDVRFLSSRGWRREGGAAALGHAWKQFALSWKKFALWRCPCNRHDSWQVMQSVGGVRCIRNLLANTSAQLCYSSRSNSLSGGHLVERRWAACWSLRDVTAVVISLHLIDVGEVVRLPFFLWHCLHLFVLVPPCCKSVLGSDAHGKERPARCPGPVAHVGQRPCGAWPLPHSRSKGTGLDEARACHSGERRRS